MSSPRGDNQPITVFDILTALSQVMPPSTQLQIAGGSVYINDDSALHLDTARWPVLLLEEGLAPVAHIGPRRWQQRLTVYATYLVRWDQDPNTLDAIWQRAVDDADRMVANITDNPTLTISATRNCLSVAKVEQTPRNQKVIDSDTYAVPVVERGMTIEINMIPYLTAA